MSEEPARTVCRLLPWSTPESKTAYLVTDDPGGMMSVLADGVEETQIETARQVLTLARQMLENHDIRMTGDEYAFVTRRLAECVRDLLRVADSRGARLGMEEAPVHGP